MSLCALPLPDNERYQALLDQYSQSHPVTVQYFRKMKDGAYWFSRLISIENSWKQRSTQLPVQCIFREKSKQIPETGKLFDIVYGGGGLATIHAALMAAVYKCKVCLFDQYGVGITHRDWNISMPELMRLHECGLFNMEELESVIAAKYENGGFVKFYDDNSKYKTTPLWMKNVLDIAIDANKLLALARTKIEAAGGIILDGKKFVALYQAEHYARICITDEHNNKQDLYGRLFADAMGAFSPVSRWLNKNMSFTHCCPTVGTISSGFEIGDAPNQVNPATGEILVTLDNMDEQGRQLIWEGFPSADNTFVTYLFFYDSVHSNADKSLLNLYEIFFENLHRYKKAGPEFDIGRPLFGIIPSYQHFSTGNTRIIADDHIICIGDAAALSSPLSYCGFGSFVRNLHKNTQALYSALQRNTLSKKDLQKISAYEPNVAIMANFATFLQGKPNMLPHAVNQTMNMFMDVLQNLPVHIAEEVFRDSLQWTSYNTMMSKVPQLYPDSYKVLLEVQGIKGLFWWAVNFIGFSWRELQKRKKDK